MPKPGQEIYEIAGLIKKITLSEIHKRIREQLNPKYHAISVIKPLSNK